MRNLESGLRGLGALMLCVVAAAPALGWGDIHRTTYLSFRHPFFLCGARVPGGTLRFERIGREPSYQVRVSRPGGGPVILQASTRLVVRPAGIPRERSVVWAAWTGEPLRLRAWFPLGEPLGHEFPKTCTAP
ncbi:MAG: hypothetical protein AB7O67_23730 [Vicinamibacterales bacterium]